MNDSVTNLQRGSQDQQNVQLVDADTESGIEIIYEGKPKNSAANGQEAPEVSEMEFKPRAKPVLSKQQQEEAAKLAEQRKRFDNQRYQNPTQLSLDSTLSTSQKLPVTAPTPQHSGPAKHD